MNITNFHISGLEEIDGKGFIEIAWVVGSVNQFLYPFCDDSLLSATFYSDLYKVKLINNVRFCSL